MNKINAHTVMEMIVVMIISSVVVTMSYTVFSKIVLLNHKVGDIYTKNYNVMLFNRLLAADFIKADVIRKEADGFSCVYKDHTVVYDLKGQLIRKQYLLVDTLFSVVDADIEYQYVDQAKSIVKGIIVSGNHDQQPIRMIYAKEYGSNLLMKLDEQGN
jgi:hypothetical protein